MTTSTVTIDLDENGLREEHVKESTSTSTASAMTMMFAFLLFAAVAHVGPFVLQKLKDDVSLTETSGGGIRVGWNRSPRYTPRERRRSPKNGSDEARFGEPDYRKPRDADPSLPTDD